MLSSHTGSVDFHHTALGRDLPGPICQKEGNRISCPPLGIECHLGPLHDAMAPMEFQNGKGEPFSSLCHQHAGQPSGWAGFPEYCTMRCLFCAIRWDEQTLLLTAPRHSFSPCHTNITSLSFPSNEISRLCLGTPCPVPQLFLMKRRSFRAFIGSFQSKSCTRKKENRLNAVSLALFTGCFRNICLK